MAGIKTEFSLTELLEMEEKLIGIKQALEIFFQEGTFRSIESWKDEAIANGVKKTRVQFNEYVNSFSETGNEDEA